MKENIHALLIRSRQEPIDPLRLALEKQSLSVITARSCAEAALGIWSSCPPHLVFTDLQLADGNWSDVLTLAGKASQPVNVIVVAPFADVGLYLEVIDRGGFDFIVPPLTDPEMHHVVRNAAENSLTRRRKLTMILPPSPLVAAALPVNLMSETPLAAED